MIMKQAKINIMANNLLLNHFIKINEFTGTQESINQMNSDDNQASRNFGYSVGVA